MILPLNILQKNYQVPDINQNLHTKLNPFILKDPNNNNNNNILIVVIIIQVICNKDTPNNLLHNLIKCLVVDIYSQIQWGVVFLLILIIKIQIKVCKCHHLNIHLLMDNLPLLFLLLYHILWIRGLLWVRCKECKILNK